MSNEEDKRVTRSQAAAAAAGVADAPDNQPPGRNAQSNEAVGGTVQHMLDDFVRRMDTMEEKISAWMREFQEKLEVTTSLVGAKLDTASETNDGTEARAVQQPPEGKGKLKPLVFDGSVSWAAYHTQFEMIASNKKWNDQEKASYLSAYLKGPALELLGHLPADERGCYRTLVRALEQRFGAMHQEQLYRAQLRARIRKADESLPMLAQDIERLAHYVYPNAAANFRATIACDQFIQALQDVPMQIATRQARPSDLQEALAAALEFESIRQAAKQTGGGAFSEHGYRTRQSQVTNDPDLLQKLLRRIEQLETSSFACDDGRHPRAREQGGTQATKFSRQGQCWNCGQPGHIQRNCQTPRRAMSWKPRNSGNERGSTDRSNDRPPPSLQN